MRGEGGRDLKTEQPWRQTPGRKKERNRGKSNLNRKGTTKQTNTKEIKIKEGEMGESEKGGLRQQFILKAGDWNGGVEVTDFPSQIQRKRGPIAFGEAPWGERILSVGFWVSKKRSTKSGKGSE